MKKQLVFLFLICTAAVQAQFLSPQVISSSGGYLDKGTISLSYTLGEFSIQTLAAGNLMLTQGFQQPLDIGTSIPETYHPDWQVKTWPNPVSKDLYLQINSDIEKDLILETFDLAGRLHLSYKFETPLHIDPYTLDFSDLYNGIYIIKIRAVDYSLQKIVKIRKQ